jgi:hypothetical protein
LTLASELGWGTRVCKTPYPDLHVLNGGRYRFPMDQWGNPQQILTREEAFKMYTQKQQGIAKMLMGWRPKSKKR